MTVRDVGTFAQLQGGDGGFIRSWRGHAMNSAAKRGHVLLTVALAAAAIVLGPDPAEAQWGLGMGLGWGWGLGMGGYVQQPSDYLNQVSLARMNHVRGPIQNDVYGNRPNAYINRIRDNGFVDRYYPDGGNPSYTGHAARSRTARVTPTAARAEATPSRRVAPLTSFFNDSNQLVWPGDAPTTGELKASREEVDKACAVAFSELKQNGTASIASATEARQKLLDYGRPALTAVKATQTSQIADGFRNFLTTLYDSLAQATEVSAPRPPA